MNAWTRSAARPHDRRQIQACRAHIALSRPVRRVLHALFFRRVYILHSARPAQSMSEPSSPSRAAQANRSAAAPSASSRPAQTMSEPSSPSRAAQANRFCRRAQRILTPSAPGISCANHERTVKPLTRRAGESLCRRAQRILTPSANHERTVKPLSCRAGELLCRRAQRIIPPRRPTAPCARRCASPWRGRARVARPAGGGSPRPA